MTRLLAFCLLLSLRPALADASLNGIYLGKSQILETAPPRQISLNADVQEWAAQPGGLEIAYVGGSLDGGGVREWVKLAGVKRGQTVTLLARDTPFRTWADDIGLNEKARAELEAATLRQPDSPIAFNPNWHTLSLFGWSADGRHLLASAGREIISVDVAASPPRPQTLTPPPPAADEDALLSASYWSPNSMRVALQTSFLPRDRTTGRSSRKVCWLYDFTANRQIVLHAEAEAYLDGWQDDNHLILRRYVGEKTVWISYDITTDTATTLAARPKRGDEHDLTKTTSERPGLALADEIKRVTDGKGAATMDAHALWIRRQNGPKMLSAFPVALTPGADSPQAGWLPGGKRVAFVSHGDLFVADLIVRPAVPREKLAAGESLTCPEERDLAVGNLKLIGLAITQYIQDNDENYPPGAGVEKTIDPYIKDPSIFAVGASRFVYKPPANRSLAAMAAPAETVIGALDLRCATISLYADGHVRAKVKPGFE